MANYEQHSPLKSINQNWRTVKLKTDLSSTACDENEANTGGYDCVIVILLLIMESANKKSSIFHFRS